MDSPEPILNATASPNVSYYSTTVLNDGANQNIITGLLIGLVVGVAILILLTGMLLVLAIVSKTRVRNEANCSIKSDPGNTSHEVDSTETQKNDRPSIEPKFQYVMPVPWPPPPESRHPLHRGLEPQRMDSAVPDLSRPEIPEALTPGNRQPQDIGSSWTPKRPPPATYQPWPGEKVVSP
ncbi:hypothetical protein JX265_013960 [Neoarthrinium moseri]|uniref:Uncharacterized protein n=1 Tax=Neoarthrinium moseri TaxID=1658444 RepID=A0A9P9W7P6_9PEZI|nr:hypothetical protein JX265_013960 [Neoarthrinium moseri]